MYTAASPSLSVPKWNVVFKYKCSMELLNFPSHQVQKLSLLSNPFGATHRLNGSLHRLCVTSDVFLTPEPDVAPGIISVGFHKPPWVVAMGVRLKFKIDSSSLLIVFLWDWSCLRTLLSLVTSVALGSPSFNFFFGLYNSGSTILSILFFICKTCVNKIGMEAWKLAL